MLFSGAKTGDAKNAAILPFERNKSQRRIIREIATNAIETYESINIFDENKKIATLTTQIYDLMWQKNRVSTDGPLIDTDVRHCQMLCGGSHFLSRSFFGCTTPYFPNKYGYEEILPSLRVFDERFFFAIFFPILYKKLLLYISLFFLPLLILYSTKKYLAIKLH